MKSSERTIYKTSLGGSFRFNDPVKVTFASAPDADLIGRLIQVRKSCGAYGTDVLIIRAADGGLRAYENACLEKYTVAELPVDDDDSTEEEYTIKGEWAESGFIVENPRQPESDSPPFAFTIIEGS